MQSTNKKENRIRVHMRTYSDIHTDTHTHKHIHRRKGACTRPPKQTQKPTHSHVHRYTNTLSFSTTEIKIQFNDDHSRRLRLRDFIYCTCNTCREARNIKLMTKKS